jgi:hypothetical protein
MAAAWLLSGAIMNDARMKLKLSWMSSPNSTTCRIPPVAHE